MKSFKSLISKNNLLVLLEYKEWHQLVKQFGDKIISNYGLGYQQPSTAEKDIIPHKTEFIKTQLGLHDIPKHHGRWILNQVIKGNIPNQEDIKSTIIPNLSKFEELKDQHQVNLSRVNNRNELFNIVQKHAPESSTESGGLIPGTDYTLHGENEHWKVIQPHNTKAACSFGGNTNWCTASGSENNMFNTYNEQGPMHILIPKKPAYKNEKYQYHEASGQFMNHADTEVNSPHTDKKLSFEHRPLPDMDEDLKYNLDFQSSFTNQSVSKDHLEKLIKHPLFGSSREHLRLALDAPYESVALAAVNHPNFDSDTQHIERALSSRHESVAKAAFNHPKFGSSMYHLPAAIESRHESVALAAMDHRYFDDRPKNMHSALISKHKSVAMKAVKHPLFGNYSRDINIALKSTFPDVAMEAVKHPKFGSANIRTAIRDSSHRSVSRAAVDHPDFGSDPEHISDALMYDDVHDDGYVQKAAVKHPNFGLYPSHIEDALRSPHESVQTAAVNHPIFGIEPRTIRMALKSPHESVAMKAINHPMFNIGTHLKEALLSPHESVAMKAMNEPMSNEVSNNRIEYALYSRHESVQKAAVNHPNFGYNSKHVEQALHSQYESVALAAVNHKKFYAEHITKALHSPHESVAMKAINHPEFENSNHGMHFALTSPHESVAMKAIKHPLFGRYNYDIYSAIRSPHESVQIAAVNHPNFDSDTQHIERALESPHESVRKLANKKLNTQTTTEPNNEVKESTNIKYKKFSTLLENIGDTLRNKKYLLESEKLFPGNKIWFSKKAGIVPIDDLNDLGMHHSNFVVHEPGKFGYTDDDIEKMVGPKHYGQLVQKSSPWSDRLITKMNEHGHFRGFYRYKKSTNPESDNSEHQFDMYDDRSWMQSDLIKRATNVSDTLDPFHEHFTHALNAVPKGQELRLKVETGLPISSELEEKLTTKHGAIVRGGDTMSTSVKFPNRQSLESYLNDTQAKRSRELPEAPREVTSSDINAALGRKPESMMPAEWNFFRRIGDSYEGNNSKYLNVKSFRSFLTESEGIYDVMRDSIENRLRDEHRKKHESGLIPEPSLKKEHIKQYGLHHSLLEPVSGRSRIDYADFDYIKKSRDNQDQEATRRVYKFYIPKEGSPTAPHHVAVTIGTRSDHDLIDPESFPSMQDVSFSIDGFESARILPEMAFEKHRAVYSGVMDAVSHHHFDTGTHDFNYNFTPTAITRQEERAKGRRYKKMAQILRKSNGSII